MPDGRGRHILRRVPALLAAAAAGAVVAAHAALMPLGAWYPDEFIQFALHQRLGWAQVADRVFGWAPRPASELLLFAYSSMVAWLDRPGVTWVLAAAWAGVLGMLLAAGRLAGLRPALSLVLMAAALIVARPGEMWFWPVAALAYLPAFAGLAAAALLLAGPRRAGGADIALCLCLLLAAGSVEIGAIAVLILSLGLLLLHAVLRALGRRIPAAAPEWPAWVWILPLALALGVFVTTLLNRLGATFEVIVPGPAAGDTWQSTMASFRHMGRMFGGVPAEPESSGAMWLGLPVKLALVAGIWALLPQGPASLPRGLACLVAAAAIVRHGGGLDGARLPAVRDPLLRAARDVPAGPAGGGRPAVRRGPAAPRRPAASRRRDADARRDLRDPADAAVRGPAPRPRPAPGRRRDPRRELARRPRAGGRHGVPVPAERPAHRRLDAGARAAPAAGPRRRAAAGPELACLRDPALLRQNRVAERVIGP